MKTLKLLIVMIFLLIGMVVKAQSDEIQQLVEKARNGDSIAQKDLGDAYFYGNVVAKDYTEAV